MMVGQDLPMIYTKKTLIEFLIPTLTKNMPNVKWDQLPPRKGPRLTMSKLWQCTKQLQTSGH